MDPECKHKYMGHSKNNRSVFWIRRSTGSLTTPIPLLTTARNVTMVMCRETTNTSVSKPRLFYVKYNGTSWSAPVFITDSIAVAWNRFDACVDPGGITSILYLKNTKTSVPELKIIRIFNRLNRFRPSAPTDTLIYFRLHCNSKGLFTMYLYLNRVKNTSTQVTFSHDAIHWSDPIQFPMI